MLYSIIYRPNTIASGIRRVSTMLYRTKHTTSKSNSTHEHDPNKPIPYTTSEANQWLARHTRTGSNSDESLWYEPYVVMASLTVFMVYFCILREENDIDMEFDKALYSRIPSLEESNLRTSLKYNEKQGLEAKAIEDRLKYIEDRKAPTTSS